MKCLWAKIIFITLFYNVAYAQSNSGNKADLYDTGNNLPKFITSNDSLIKLHVLEDVSEIDAKDDLIYYWYTLNQLHKTKGGYSGKLLNGLYQVFNVSNNELMEQGDFENGLKTGKWIRWYKNGQISEITNWKKSMLNGEKLTYNSKGDLQSRYTYVNDILHGKSVIYADSTNQSRLYKSGKLIKSHSDKKKK